MCAFITLIAPSRDRITIDTVMRRHGRAATSIDNPSVRSALLENEAQYLTTTRGCDCGTVLAAGDPEARLDAALQSEAARLARKGWSHSKIARAIEDQRRAAARPNPRQIDSIPLWAAIIDDLLVSLSLPHAGLLIHSYSGSISDERFSVARHEPPPTDLKTAIAAITWDEMTILQH